MKYSAVLAAATTLKSVSAIPHLSFGNGDDQSGSGFFEGFGAFFHPSDIPVPRFTANPTSAPTNPPTKGPTKAPTEAPTRSPVLAPTPTPTAGPSPAPTIATLGADHQFQWGSATEGCFYYTPDVFLNCGEGGFLTTTGLRNSKCDQLSLDYIKCSIEDSGEDAFVDFTCTGITDDHLTARARIFESEAIQCDKVYQETVEGDVTDSVLGGNAVAFGTLGRKCANGNGDEELVNDYGCVEGLEGKEKGVAFCAAGEMCTVQQQCTAGDCTGDDSCITEVDAITITNPDSNPSCSYVENSIDLSEFDFMSSTLASYHVVEWTYSANGLGCTWDVPDITLTCQNGGEISLEEAADFCTIQGDTMTCSDPNNDPSEGRVSQNLFVWCRGASEEQLVLSASTAAVMDSGATCANGGMAIQGVRISRACGLFGEDDFEFVAEPDFCSSEEQLHQQTNLCYAGDLCSEPDSCNSVDVPSVHAEASSASVRNCIYAV